ncbi:MAG: FKBP-type peptidyl-prolyl cis-trans isomerase [Thermoplasmatales archaeon]|nr:MAG: FKBP-type peptidyl-prolyl cis-trans isomerase [Thermoplasmatales archaeon]
MIISFNTDMNPGKSSKPKKDKTVIAAALLAITIICTLTVFLIVTYYPDIIENLFKEEQTIESGDLADVHYIGRYTSNNEIFDSSYDDPENKTGGTPLKIFVNLNRSELPPEGYEGYSSEVIDGLLEGLVGLKEGVTTTIGPIPPEKAYGANKLKIGDIFSTSNLAMVLNQTVQVINLTEESISFKWVNMENFGKFTMPQLIIKDLISTNISDMVIYPPPYYLWENSTEIINISDETATVYTTPTKSENITEAIEGAQYEDTAIFIFPDATTAVWNDTTITITSSPEIGKNYTLTQEGPEGPITLIFTVENITNNTINISFVFEGQKSYQESIKTLEFNRTFTMPRMYNSIPSMYMYIFEEDILNAGYSTHELAGEELIFEVSIKEIYKPS